MLKLPSLTHRRTHSDIQERTVNVDVSLSVPGQGSDGQLDLDRTALGSPHIEKKSGGGFIVRRQMKQVVGELVTVLGELKTVVGDIRTLVTQIDVVTHKLDQSVSSDQSDKSTGSYDLLKAVSRSRSRSRSSGSCTVDQSETSFRNTSSCDNETGHVVSKKVANMCDLSCFHGEKDQTKSHRSLNSHGSRSRSSGSTNTASFVDRQGERLSNHDTVYVAYRPKSNYFSSKRPLSTPNKTANPLMGAARDRENYSKPKRTHSKSNPYIAHIYENIKAFTRKNTTDGKISLPCNKTQDRFANIPNRTQKNRYISISTQQNTQQNGTKETARAMKTNNGKHKIKSSHKNKKKNTAEYSGMYEKEMEEKLELEFDDSLDLLDTLAEIQTVDNEFDQGFEDYDLVRVRDPYPIDMVRKHADVVAWAQSAWPEARLLGNSLDYSDNTEDETDSEWYEAPPAIPKSINPHLADFRWRTVIEP